MRSGLGQRQQGYRPAVRPARQGLCVITQRSRHIYVAWCRSSPGKRPCPTIGFSPSRAPWRCSRPRHPPTPPPPSWSASTRPARKATATASIRASRATAATSPSSSIATNLANGVGSDHVFVRDRVAHTTAAVDVSTSGQLASSFSFGALISRDGSHVAFFSNAANLVTGDTNGRGDVFERDLKTGTTVRVSVKSNGKEPHNSDSFPDAISANGRYVAFETPRPQPDRRPARSQHHLRPQPGDREHAADQQGPGRPAGERRLVPGRDERRRPLRRLRQRRHQHCRRQQRQGRRLPLGPPQRADGARGRQHLRPAGRRRRIPPLRLGRRQRGGVRPPRPRTSCRA